MNCYPFIEAEKQSDHNVKRACELLQGSRSAYYADRVGGPSLRQQRDDELTGKIIAIHDESDLTYGSPRVHHELLEQGQRCSRKRVVRLMQAADRHGRAPRRWKKTTIPDPAAAQRPDLIGRDFAIDPAQPAALSQPRHLRSNPRHHPPTGSVNQPHINPVRRTGSTPMFSAATREIDILAYAGLFLAENGGLIDLLRQKAESGVRVRIALDNPDGASVAQRGTEEEIGSALASKIRNALILYRPILRLPAVELRLHDTVLYNSMYRADNQLLVNQHVLGIPAAQAPVFHFA